MQAWHDAKSASSHATLRATPQLGAPVRVLPLHVSIVSVGCDNMSHMVPWPCHATASCLCTFALHGMATCTTYHSTHAQLRCHCSCTHTAHAGRHPVPHQHMLHALPHAPPMYTLTCSSPHHRREAKMHAQRERHRAAGGGRRRGGGGPMVGGMFGPGPMAFEVSEPVSGPVSCVGLGMSWVTGLAWGAPSGGLHGAGLGALALPRAAISFAPVAMGAMHAHPTHQPLCLRPTWTGGRPRRSPRGGDGPRARHGRLRPWPRRFRRLHGVSWQRMPAVPCSDPCWMSRLEEQRTDNSCCAAMPCCPDLLPLAWPPPLSTAGPRTATAAPAAAGAAAAGLTAAGATAAGGASKVRAWRWMVICPGWQAVFGMECARAAAGRRVSSCALPKHRRHMLPSHVRRLQSTTRAMTTTPFPAWRATTASTKSTRSECSCEWPHATWRHWAD